ncbi:unnamed protein product [Prunus armeniaca]
MSNHKQNPKEGQCLVGLDCKNKEDRKIGKECVCEGGGAAVANGGQRGDGHDREEEEEGERGKMWVCDGGSAQT